jgi:hypothetical protein
MPRNELLFCFERNAIPLNHYHPKATIISQNHNKQPIGISYLLALFSSRLCGYMPCADAFSLAIAFRIRLRGAPVSWIRFGLRYRPAISRGSLAAVAPAVHTNFPGIPGLLIFEPVYSRIVAGSLAIVLVFLRSVLAWTSNQ